jgi:hypothetical protein
MGVIINPRGTSGSGKTELVRRVLAQYGWRRGTRLEGVGGLEPLWREGRSRPLGYASGIRWGDGHWRSLATMRPPVAGATRSELPMAAWMRS